MAILKAGHGYWEKANYANRFRRDRNDLPVEVVTRGVHPPRNGFPTRINIWIRLASGEVVEARADAVVDDDSTGTNETRLAPFSASYKA